MGFAIQHLNTDTEADRRLAFLLLDVAVEAILKTYLLLPESTTGVRTSYQDRKKAASGVYHKLLAGVEAAAPEGLLEAIDLQHLHFFHQLRNTLYHQANGVTVPAAHIQAYARVSVDLMVALLDVDMSPELERPLAVQEAAERLRRITSAADQSKQRVNKELKAVEETVPAVIETIDPRLVLPSFVQQFEAFHSAATDILMRSFASGKSPYSVPGSSPETHTKWDDEEATKAVFQLMPEPLQTVLMDRDVSPSTTVKLGLTSDLVALWLVVADLVLALETDPSDHVYDRGKLFLTMEPGLPGPLPEGPSGWEELIEDGAVLEVELRKVREALVSRMHGGPGLRDGSTRLGEDGNRRLTGRCT